MHGVSVSVVLRSCVRVVFSQFPRREGARVDGDTNETQNNTKREVTYEDGALEAGLHEDEVLGGEVHDQGNEGRPEHGHGTTDAHHLLLVHPISIVSMQV